MKRKAFSLIELLTVVAMMGILLALVTPAFTSIASSHRVFQGTSLALSQIELARQLAEVRNRTVEVRFLRKDANSPFSAMQLWWSATDQPAEKPVVLPEGTLWNEALSPWLATMQSGTMPATGPWGGAAYRSFAIRPSGEIEPRPPAADRARLFLTVSAREEPTPANYATIQLNPDTARPMLYRP